jgi:hypothetical protein
MQYGFQPALQPRYFLVRRGTVHTVLDHAGRQTGITPVPDVAGQVPKDPPANQTGSIKPNRIAMFRNTEGGEQHNRTRAAGTAPAANSTSQPISHVPGIAIAIA